MVSLWTPLKQSSFIFLMGGEKEGSFAEKGPYHHHLQQPKGRELGSGLAEEFELILCSSRQGSAASPFLICMRSLLPFMTHSLHGSNPSIAAPRVCCGPTQIQGSTASGGNGGWPHPTHGMSLPLPLVRGTLICCPQALAFLFWYAAVLLYILQIIYFHYIY